MLLLPLCYYWFIALLDGGRKACHFYVGYCHSVHKVRLGCVLIMLAPPLQQSYILFFLDISVKINIFILRPNCSFPPSLLSPHSHTHTLFSYLFRGCFYIFNCLVYLGYVTMDNCAIH